MSNSDRLHVGPELQLASDLLNYCDTVDQLRSAEEVLDRLHRVVRRPCGVGVLGAALFPLRWGDWPRMQRGKTVFLHHSVPKGWWEEYSELNRKYPEPGFLLAQYSIAPFTVSEFMRMVDPVGLDRWSQELSLKYGMRDFLACPIGGRWVVAYWSRSVLTEALSRKDRAMLYTGAAIAAMRLQQLIGLQVVRIGDGVSLTPRELAVLRSLSVGMRMRETAEHLKLGEETIRSHLRNAEEKLGVHGRTHAVALAIRRHLIP